jgi:vacuolar protein sorting-associated protein 72
VQLKVTDKCSRTFITFTDEKNFKEHFPRKRVKIPIQQYCPVTRMPAKYFDPITQTPYASIMALKVIRDAYKQHVEKEKDKGESKRRSVKGSSNTVQSAQAIKT